MTTLSHGALQAFLAVVMGAFAAHGLQHRLDDYGMRIWQTAVQYQVMHALALVALGLLEAQRARTFRASHWCFGLGIVLFSGSLYALALSGVKALGMITPFGGTLFLAGWLALAWQARRSAQR